MIKSSKLLIDLLVPWTNHFMVCSMVCSGVLSWIDFFKSYLMILLKKLRFLFVKININISNLIFLPPHPPRRFPVQKVVPWPESEPATQLPTTWTDRAPSQEHCCLFCQVDGGWRPGWAWRKVICPVERTCLTLVASTSLQSLQFGSCIAAQFSWWLGDALSLLKDLLMLQSALITFANILIISLFKIEVFAAACLILFKFQQFQAQLAISSQLLVVLFSSAAVLELSLLCTVLVWVYLPWQHKTEIYLNLTDSLLNQGIILSYSV